MKTLVCELVHESSRLPVLMSRTTFSVCVLWVRSWTNWSQDWPETEAVGTQDLERQSGVWPWRHLCMTRCGWLSQWIELYMTKIDARPRSTSTRPAATLKTDYSRASWLTGWTERCSSQVSCVWTSVCAVSTATERRVSLRWQRWKKHVGEMAQPATERWDAKISDNLRQVDTDVCVCVNFTAGLSMCVQ